MHSGLHQMYFMVLLNAVAKSYVYQTKLLISCIIFILVNSCCLTNPLHIQITAPNKILDAVHL